MSNAPDWAGSNRDIWAERWIDLDRVLAPIGTALQSAVLEAAPEHAFAAFDIGCGAGTSSLSLAAARPDATILGCDLSANLVEIASGRAADMPSLRFEVGDAVRVASEHRPFDLFLSRHGVMFFPDPPTAFRIFRESASEGAALVFSCFRDWHENPWASEVAGAAAGKDVPPPGREPSGFAFADALYVTGLLQSAGWSPTSPEPVSFRYVAGEGADAAEQALSLLTKVGPAAAVLRDLPPSYRGAAVDRMRAVIDRYRDGAAISFPAAGWVWRATAAA